MRSLSHSLLVWEGFDLLLSLDHFPLPAFYPEFPSCFACNKMKMRVCIARPIQLVVIQFVLFLFRIIEGNEPFHINEDMRKNFEALQIDSEVLSDGSHLLLGDNDDRNDIIVSRNSVRRYLTANEPVGRNEKHDYPYKWVSCCDNTASDAAKDYGDPKSNFILPVTTSGQSYKIFQCLTSLNDAAQSSKIFRFVEPFALLAKAEDVRAPEVVPLRRLLKFDTIRDNKEDYPQFISLNEWGQTVGVHNTSASEMLTSFQNSLIFVDFIPLKPTEALGCKAQFDEKICMRMVKKRHGGSSLQLQYIPSSSSKASFKPNLLRALFVYVLDSYWAKETGFNQENPISFGLTDDWYEKSIEIGLLKKSDDLNSYSLSYVDRVNEKPLFGVSDYMLWNADAVMRQLVRPRIMVAWSLEDHLMDHNSSHPGVNVRVDEMGFLIGCQINSIYATLEDVADNNVLFSFDIFHTKQHPSYKTWEEVEVSSFTRRDVIHSLRSRFPKFSVVQHLARNGRFVQLDPYNLFTKTSKNMFFYWLDIAIGRLVENYVSAGGDMDKTIRILRGDRQITKIHGDNCESASKATDDMILMLEHSDDGMKKIIDGTGGEKFYRQTFHVGYSNGDGTNHRTSQGDKMKRKRTPAAEKIRRKKEAEAKARAIAAAA